MSSKKKSKLKETLDLEDVFCIACRCIYLQPVSMPCGHILCLECFKNMVNITAYQCPICRKRISNWLRKYKHNWDLLVDEDLWKAVQQQYPIEVQKKLNDEDDGLEERIVNQGFTRIQIKEGELKREFDIMRMNLLKEQEKTEQQSLELAKQLQEEEEVNRQTRQIINEQLIHNDVKIASTIQEQIQEELQREQILLNKSDMQLAMSIQDQMSITFADTKRKLECKKQNSPKKGPLDIMFAKLSPKNSKVQYRNKEYSLSSCSSSNSESLIQSSSSSSSFYSSPSTMDAIQIFGDENYDTCTCGRLQNNFDSNKPPCQFCTAQITMLDELLSQQKSDFLMAKELEDKLKMENFDNYNLRKRSSSTRIIKRRKIRKLSKGQQTLKQVLQEK